MNVGRHLARLKNLGFSLLLALATALLSQPPGTTSFAGASPSSNATRGPNQERHAVPSELAPVHFIAFRNKYGQTGVLDWKGDRVVYSGDLPIDQGTKVRTPSSNHCMLGRPALMEPRFVTPLQKPTSIL